MFRLDSRCGIRMEAAALSIELEEPFGCCAVPEAPSACGRQPDLRSRGRGAPKDAVSRVSLSASASTACPVAFSARSDVSIGESDARGREPGTSYRTKYTPGSGRAFSSRAAFIIDFFGFATIYFIGVTRRTARSLRARCDLRAGAHVAVPLRSASGQLSPRAQPARPACGLARPRGAYKRARSGS